MKDITVQELEAGFQEKEDFILLDIREDFEVEMGHIQSTHIPMGEIANQVDSLNRKKPTYVLCKTGQRAAATINFLATNYGFENLAIVIGGVEAYAKEIDQTLIY